MIEKKFYGERLRSARMYRGLTLTELAKRTEISKQSLSLYENAISPEFIIRPFSRFPEVLALYHSLQQLSPSYPASHLRLVAKMYEILLEFISFPEMNLPSVDFVGCDDVFECENEDAIQGKQVVSVFAA